MLEIRERVDRFKRFGRRDGAAGALLDRHLVPIRLDNSAGTGGQERVTGDAFAANDGFQQTRVIGAAGESFVRGDRREMVGQECAVDRNRDPRPGRRGRRGRE